MNFFENFFLEKINFLGFVIIIFFTFNCFACLMISPTFVFVDNNSILNSYFFIIEIKDLPIEPVDPRIAIFFIIKLNSLLNVLNKKLELQIAYRQFYQVYLHDLV